LDEHAQERQGKPARGLTETATTFATYSRRNASGRLRQLRVRPVDLRGQSRVDSGNALPRLVAEFVCVVLCVRDSRLEIFDPLCAGSVVRWFLRK
jgi:hypothetical protein